MHAHVFRGGVDRSREGRQHKDPSLHAHFVLAHPEPRSFNAHLVRSGAEALEQDGWTTSVSDLYAMGFDPCERAEFFESRVATDRFDVQSEQRHASETKTLPKAVTDELALMDRADLLVLQYPMWWHLPPAMLKGWFDRVLAYGDAYTGRKRWENGRFVGKRAMLSVTVGTSRETYAFDGRSGDIDLMLWPVNFSLAYVGYEVLTPFIAYGVEAGLRYSDPEVVEARLRAIVEDFRAELPRANTRSTLAFNRMDEWGADGRIVPGAPVHSAFIRRKRILELE
jgi:NAD(P)H dehydrogenase (quinone)